MRQRLGRRLPDRCDIRRRQQVGTNDIGEPIYERRTVASDVPCRFDNQSSTQGTSFVREDSGERVERPSTLAVAPTTDIEAGDTVTVDGVDQTFEVRGTNPTRDKRRDRVVEIVIELERAD